MSTHASQVHTFPVSTTTHHSRILTLVTLTHATPTCPHIYHAAITDFRNWKVWHLGSLQGTICMPNFIRQANWLKVTVHTGIRTCTWNCDSLRKTTSMEKSSLRNSKFFTELEVIVYIHKSPSTLPILSQIYPPHTATSQLFEVHFHVILLSTSRPYDKIWMHFSSLLCVLNATHISSSFILST